MPRPPLQLVLLLALLALAAAAPSAASTRIHFMLSSDQPPYQQVVTAAAAALGTDLSVSSSADGLIPEDADVVVTVGVEATQTFFARADARPLFAVMVPAAAWQAMAHGVSNATAVFLDQPIARQIALIQALLPEARDLGVVFGSRSLTTRAELQQATAAAGLRIHATQPVSEHDILTAVMLVLRRSDVLFALPDPAIFNRSTAREILLTSFRMRRPLIGFSEGWVRAGALSAVYSTPQQHGIEVSELVTRWLQNRGRLPSATFSTRYTIAVNRQVAFSLGLSIPTDEALRTAVDSAERQR